MACAQDIKDPTSIFDCSICLEKFKTPVNLPCLHTFCELCLDTYINSVVTDVKLSFNCPVCRMKCDLKDKNGEKWTAQFPFNDSISLLMSNDDKSSKKIFPDYCDPCQRVGGNVNAVNWCSDCNEAYCSDCSKSFHNRLRNSHSHTITEMKRAETGTPDLEVPTEESCLKHKGRPLEVICKTHFALCCAICLKDEHLGCKDVKPIDDFISAFSGNNYGEKYLHDIKHIHRGIKKMVETKQMHIRKIDEQKEKLISDTEKIINRVIAMLLKSKKDIRKKVSKDHTLVKKAKQQQIDTLNCVKSNISQSLKNLEMLSGFDDSKKLLNFLLKMKPNLFEHYKLFSGHSLDDQFTTFTLKIDPTLLVLSAKKECCLVETNSSTLTKNVSHTVVEERLRTLNSRFYEIACNKSTLSKSDNVSSLLHKPVDQSTVVVPCCNYRNYKAVKSDKHFFNKGKESYREHIRSKSKTRQKRNEKFEEKCDKELKKRWTLEEGTFDKS